MRRIRNESVVIFNIIVGVAFLFAATLVLALDLWHLSELFAVLSFCSLFLFFSVLNYRIYFYFRPMPNGEIPIGSEGEKRVMAYHIFGLFICRPIMSSKLLPIPLTRPANLALGCRVGEGTYFAGMISDPLQTTVGSNTIIGDDSLVLAHVIEGDHMAYLPVVIGNNVTIGAKAIVMPGSRIGNDSIVAAGSIVVKNTQIGDNEVWAGSPAKRIK